MITRTQKWIYFYSQRTTRHTSTQTHTHTISMTDHITYLSMHTHLAICHDSIYHSLCVCVRVSLSPFKLCGWLCAQHEHTHTHPWHSLYIHITQRTSCAFFFIEQAVSCFIRFSFCFPFCCRRTFISLLVVPVRMKQRGWMRGTPLFAPCFWYWVGRCRCGQSLVRVEVLENIVEFNYFISERNGFIFFFLCANGKL